MRYILIIAALFCSLPQISSQNNITYGAGISYTNGAPSFTPSARTSRVAIDTVTGKWYHFNTPGGWQLLGNTIEEIAGCSAPAYTPTKGDSKVVINGCTAPELYYWTGSAWVWINEGTTYFAGEGIRIENDTIILDSLELNELHDVFVPSPINNQVLTWDNIDKRWEAKTVADSSATNELQTLSVAANTATLSNGGGSVTIAGAGINTVGTAGTTITVTGTEVDGSVSNELQTISTGTNTLTLSNGGGTVTVDTDPASDVTGLGTSGQVSFWTGAQTQSGDNGLFWNNTDKRLGIGTNSPEAPLQVQGSGTGATNAFTVVNSTPTTVFTVLNNGRIQQTVIGATNNTIFGTNAGNNTTGSGNSFFGVNSGIANTTGFNNTFFGLQSGQSNTTGQFNTYFGEQAGSGNITGSANTALGSRAGLSITNGSDNSFFGNFAGAFLTAGSNNAFFGKDAGRFIAGGGNLAISNNSIFFGWGTRANGDNETNQIVIGYDARGLGSNTTRIGNTSTTQTWLGGSLTLGTQVTPAARLHVVGSGTSSSTWTAQFHNASTGGNNALMIRDDGNIGIGTSSPGAKLQINGSGNTNASTALTVQNSDGVNLLRIRNDLYTSINYLRVGNSFSTSTLVFPFVTNSGTPDAAGTNLSFYNYTGANSAVNGAFAFAGNNFTQTSGSHVFFRFGHNFFPTSGNASYSAFTVKPSITQSGGANGITRGFHVDPTLGSAADWRSIEWSNSSGWGLYGAGTAKSYFAGNVAIGTTAQDASSAFEVTSTTQGILFPRMTTTERDLIATPADGLVIYNTTDNKLQVRAGGAWVDLH
jgi:hypothetical protein